MMYGRYAVGDYASGMGPWIHLGLGMFSFILIVGLLFILIKELMKHMESNKSNSALDELKMRLARGEIEEKEYLSKKDLLS